MKELIQQGKMKRITKENLSLLGSAGSLSDLQQMIEKRMMWTVKSITPSMQFMLGRKMLYDVTTSKGVNENVVVVRDNRRYKLYMVKQVEI